MASGGPGGPVEATGGVQRRFGGCSGGAAEVQRRFGSAADGVRLVDLKEMPIYMDSNSIAQCFTLKTKKSTKHEKPTHSTNFSKC